MSVDVARGVQKAEGDGHGSWFVGDCGTGDGEGDLIRPESSRVLVVVLVQLLVLRSSDMQLPSDTSTAWLHASTASRSFWREGVTVVLLVTVHALVVASSITLSVASVFTRSSASLSVAS